MSEDKQTKDDSQKYVFLSLQRDESTDIRNATQINIVIRMVFNGWLMNCQFCY